MKVKTAYCSSKGKFRSVNQDNFCVCSAVNEESEEYAFGKTGSIFGEITAAVCDGMGGALYGDKASLLSAKEVANFGAPGKSFRKSVSDMVLSASRKIIRYREMQKVSGMGSTIAVLTVSPRRKKAYCANVGDSKIILFRNKELQQLSYDHNEYELMKKHGIESGTDGKNSLTQYLGMNGITPEPYFTETEIQKNDIFLLCSDGLTETLEKETIIDILSKDAETADKCRMLIDSAENAKDNVTAVLCEVRGLFG